MKKQWGLVLGLIVLPMALVAEAEDKPASGIYRSVDANGNVVFTDQPPESGDAEQVQLRELNTVPTDKMKQVLDSGNEPQETAEEGYSSLVITSPDNEATVRNPESAVPVSVKLEPALKPGDSMVLYDNGVAQPGMELEMPDRGLHRVEVKVLDADGKVKISSPVIEFYIHRSTVSDFRQRPGFDRNGAAANVGGAASVGGSASVGGAASAGGAASVGGAAKPARPARPALPRPAPRN
ncbi:DUF4124 domain-containing protein [Alcanivorax sp. DP30]|uniref:DUF4124 domain-containing protein n=1 Tax=Alcanivorax sp. DP30 TaxID=2606217 RepID=UPI00136E27EE|nr:DUF4124 domain-containing protein [Alcanivorax sp. DP30]